MGGDPVRHRRRQLARQRRTAHRQDCVSWAEILALTAARRDYPRAWVSKRKPTQVRGGVATVYLDVLATGRVAEISTTLWAAV